MTTSNAPGVPARAGAGAAPDPGGPPPPAAPPLRARRRRGRGAAAQENRAGLLFSAPAVTGLLVFLIAPILMSLWVSFLDWDGQSNPLTPGQEFVGTDNYRRLLVEDTLLHRDFMLSVRNTLYYVLINVPLVTALSFGLALVVNQRLLKGRTFFRTVFYFPSVTSSVAVSITFLFLFQGAGAVNALLALAGVDGPNWFTDSRGVLHVLFAALGLVEEGTTPGWAAVPVGGLPLWEWLAGPSVALCAVIALTTWQSSGIYMLFFLAGLQNIPVSVEEAAVVDGASAWRRFRHVTLPLMRRSVTLVMTLALIATWQVFDQIYIMSQGAPAKTTITPAYLSYVRSFGDGQFGAGAAVAFALFGIIVVLTALQRWIGREKK
ncbi:carbohydrate ABC transporter permease [Nocardiopsis sediminis]|uniref:Carbohydrate ABC transporter permease n=1 Tax=Nocardiopsis sediminis TaxID=1778267 RepID=A0ABV8FIP6_9ACTN